MTSNRSLSEIEKDIMNIDHALLTVSEVRSSLKQFTNLVQSDKKNSNFVHAFGESLRNVKRDLNNLSTEGEQLKGALEHAQILANENKFNWNLIKSEVEKEAVEEENRYKEELADTGKAKEIGSLVKASADHVYNELATITFERRPTLLSQEPLFFTKYIDEWIKDNKPEDIDFSITFVNEERKTLTGSTCCIKIYSRKALAAILDLEYYQNSDSLIIHQYVIKSVKEEKYVWQESQHLVFQKLNLLASNAFEDMLAFYAKESLYNILSWFISYHDLFTKPCHRCQKILQFDSPQYKYLPPIVRTWKKKEVFEENSESSIRIETGITYHMRCFIEYKNNHAL
ncbi:uncharacterized protein BX663DRAFT_509613 [Cokeromyces recurvatus]|uniref:uncharacterized protein n=1 Tax=Cokeromyces recurvatus TaxID=90255 RepID=UPI00221E9164|nr:uncharacterized protein BX663DRAFT_509613 [Cokeromyces recurvatus]KAI7903118.1 hypothetical protein BX663DRAFT_509613 [Cokeromyces recurvatus]